MQNKYEIKFFMKSTDVLNNFSIFIINIIINIIINKN